LYVVVDSVEAEALDILLESSFWGSRLLGVDSKNLARKTSTSRSAVRFVVTVATAKTTSARCAVHWVVIAGVLVVTAVTLRVGVAVSEFVSASKDLVEALEGV
jgi:hypothetical protein